MSYHAKSNVVRRKAGAPCTLPSALSASRRLVPKRIIVQLAHDCDDACGITLVGAVPDAETSRTMSARSTMAAASAMGNTMSERPWREA